MEKKTTVYDLRCRGEKNCLNVLANEAEFTWRLQNCACQKSAKLDIYDGETLVYTQTQTGACQRIRPDILPLKSLTAYTWTVTVQTDLGESTSESATFTAGLLDGFPFTAKWIGNGAHFVEETTEVGTPAVYFKRSFQTEQPTKRALVNVCGLGFYELKINGKRVGDRVLEPAFTQYDKRVLYSTYDVTDLLVVGENVVEAVVGDGWFNQTTIDTWGFYRAAWRDNPKFLFYMDYDGETLVSDETWQTAKGTICANALRAGETWDLRIQSEYQPVAITPPPGGILAPAYLPPIRECETLLPVAILQGKDCTIYDFGKNITGYCEITLSGKDGDCVKIVYSDRIKDGECDNASNSMYIFNKGVEYQTDTFVLDGGRYALKPKFVYHGFRYAAVYGQAKAEEVKALFVRTDLQSVGGFESSSAALNQLHAMSRNAIVSNYHSFPTDCPHREKNGWTGDAQLSLEASIYNFDMLEAYRKWLDDFIDNQRPSGQISAIIPSCGWGFNWGSGPAWDIAFFRITYALYYYYDDRYTAKKVYPYLKKYYRYIAGYKSKADGLLCVGLGDWNYPRKITFPVCPTELTDSGYYVLMSEILAKLAAWIEPEAQSIYEKEAAQTKLSIYKKYANEQSLTGLAALTYFGIADKSKETAAYLEENGCVLHTGILGAKFVLDTLGKSGRSDLAVKILERKEYPSFGYWAENGQTSLCEDFELTNSLNHHMYSCVAEYMSRYLCGLELGQGMRSAKISPRLPENMSYAQTEVHTLQGDYRIRVERTEQGQTVHCEVPTGACVEYNGEHYFTGVYTWTE